MTDDIEQYVQSEFPQIAFHGGSFDLIEDGQADGTVLIALGGACNGCAISPQTAQLLERRMVEDFEHVDEVIVQFQGGFM